MGNQAGSVPMQMHPRGGKLWTAKWNLCDAIPIPCTCCVQTDQYYCPIVPFHKAAHH